MKYIYTLLLALVTTCGCYAQNHISYFMEGSTMRSQWNPAFAPQRGYFNFPFLGNLQLGVNGNVALDNILFLQDGKLQTILSSKVPASLALSGLSDMNIVGATINMNVLGFGSYTKNHKNFWSVDVNIKSETELRVPYELFSFAKSGTSGSFANLGADSNNYVEASFAYSFPFPNVENLYLGARVKFLMGVGRVGFNFDKFDAYMGADRWYASATGVLEAAGVALDTQVTDDGREVYSLEDLDVENLSLPCGYGLGVDLGATYNVLPELQLSMSVNDIGFISWSKSSSSVGRVDRDLEFTGVEIDADGNATQPSFDLEELDFEVVDAHVKSKSLRASLNVGAEYNFLGRRISAGLFYNARFWRYKTISALTGSVNFRPLKWLHASGSYTVAGKYGNSVGLALNICPGFINLFVATDMLLCRKTPQWIPIEQSTANITFGLGFPIGPKGERYAHTY